MMRRVVVAGVAGLFALALVGCPKKKNPLDDGGLLGLLAEAGTLEPGAFADKPIENDNDVTHYPQEQKVGVVVALQRQTVTHKSPPNGTDLATLPAGTTVKKVVQKENYFMIAYDDPTSGKRMAGWVGEDAFTAPAASATVTATAKWVPPVVKDAGVPATPQDAGGVSQVKDAGGGQVAAQDAGGGGNASAGGCPAGQRNVAAAGKPAMCLKTCAKNGDCDTGQRCTASKFGTPAVCVAM